MTPRSENEVSPPARPPTGSWNRPGPSVDGVSTQPELSRHRRHLASIVRTCDRDTGDPLLGLYPRPTAGKRHGHTAASRLRWWLGKGQPSCLTLDLSAEVGDGVDQRVGSVKRRRRAGH